jgi:hypothetical protein
MVRASRRGYCAKFAGYRTRSLGLRFAALGGRAGGGVTGIPALQVVRKLAKRR